MKELSIFVDESGDFGLNDEHSPYYIVTMVFHNQAVDLSKKISRLDKTLENLDYKEYAVHTEPLIWYIPEGTVPSDTAFTEAFHRILKVMVSVCPSSLNPV